MRTIGLWFADFADQCSGGMTIFSDDINYLIYVFLTYFFAFGFYHYTYNRLCTAFTDEYSSCFAESFCNALYSCLYIRVSLSSALVLNSDVFEYLWILNIRSSKLGELLLA